MTDAEVNRVLAMVAALLMLFARRRTRPLAGVLYGLWLSRAHGAALRAANDGALGAAKRGGCRHDRHEQRLDAVEQRLDAVWERLGPWRSEVFREVIE